MKLRVLYHGHCFDGVASAATFTRFYLERIDANTKVSYGGLLHRPNNLLFDRDMFDGDWNLALAAVETAAGPGVVISAGAAPFGVRLR